jgi:large subunit ribosomal protein L23
MNNLYAVIKKPVITEKSAIMSEDSKYTFFVDKSTNKIEVKNAFKLVYGVDPKEVKIMNTKPKSSTRRGLKKKGMKKAIIVLQKGETVDLSRIK